MKSSSIERHIAHLSQCLRETITAQMAKQHISLSFFQGLILLHIGEFERCTAHDLVVQTKKNNTTENKSKKSKRRKVGKDDED